VTADIECPAHVTWLTVGRVAYEVTHEVDEQVNLGAILIEVIGDPADDAGPTTETDQYDAGFRVTLSDPVNLVRDPPLAV
jgi:hypothetical protein